MRRLILNGAKKWSFREGSNKWGRASDLRECLINRSPSQRSNYINKYIYDMELYGIVHMKSKGENREKSPQ